MGRIARAVAQRAHHGFGMKVIYHDPFPPPADVAAALGAEPRAELDAVLREADFVSLHCPATPETRHLMNRERLALMRPDAFLVNTARGDVVDEAALVEALQRKTIAGAGLDVFEREPAGDPRAAEHGERRAAAPSRQRHHGDPGRHGHAGAGKPAALLQRQAAPGPRGVTDAAVELFATPADLPESADPVAASAAAYANEVVELLPSCCSAGPGSGARARAGAAR